MEPAAQIEKLDKALEIGKKFMGGEPYTLNGALNGMAACIHDMARSFIVMGRYAMAIKEMAPKGDFERIMQEKFEEPGICTVRTIRNSMAVAKFAMEKGAHLDYFRELPKMKQLMLSGASESDIGEDGSIFGISEQEIKSTNIKTLKKKIEAQQEVIDDQNASIEKGREQLADAKEKIRTLKDRTKILNSSEQDTREKLQKDLDLVMGVCESLLEQIDPKKLTPAQITEIKKHTVGVATYTADWADAVAAKLEGKA